MTMFSFNFTEVWCRSVRFPPPLWSEVEANFIEPLFLFWIHISFQTLRLDPFPQLWFILVPLWHISCKSGRETGGVLVRVFKMKVKQSTAQNQLTVTMFFFKFTQFLELHIPFSLVRPFRIGVEIETNLVELRFSLRIHYFSFEDGPLTVDPIAQLRVFLGHLWYIACNSGRATDGVLVRVLR
jgi:hypothetical protein